MFLRPFLTLRAGTLADYRALAHLHYRGRTPAVAARVFAVEFDAPAYARRRGRFALEPAGVVAVVVYTHPLPACRARDRATGGRYRAGRAPGAALRRLNREVRTLSRLVVEPRLRALGLGHALVRATVGRLGVDRVETLAAMGAAIPLFDRAGFVRVPGPGTPYFLWTRRRRARQAQTAPGDCAMMSLDKSILSAAPDGGPPG